MTTPLYCTGPWQQLNTENDDGLFTIVGNCDGEDYGGEHVYIHTVVATVELGDDRAEALANARLIAAAPELLAALKACALVCSGETLSKGALIEALQKANDAIALAEGRS